MRLPFALALVLSVLGGTASAQPRQPPPPLMNPVDMMRADFLARTGSDKVYFANDGHGLDASARATLAAQARWLLLNPHAAVRIEGHADERETRSRALAIGERRADAVRDFLVLQGVPSNQIAILSWGKERPEIEGVAPMAIARNRRAVTVLMPPGPF
jgi:peptidoglycan-associated lipoprotein